jgi:hypothetical protein
MLTEAIGQVSPALHLVHLDYPAKLQLPMGQAVHPGPAFPTAQPEVISTKATGVHAALLTEAMGQVKPAPH